MAGKTRVDVAARKRRALELRAQGLAAHEIAADLGVAETTARGYLTDALADRKAAGESTSEAVQLELARLDAVERALSDLVEQASVVLAAQGFSFVQTPPEDLLVKASAQLIAVSKRRSDLLGLDSSEKREPERARDLSALDELRARRDRRRA
jgi:DNA-binding CsgD family transcriptional regulator